MLTPEAIENVSPADHKMIGEMSEALHGAVPGVLDSILTGADMKEQAGLRGELKLKIGEAIRDMDRQIQDLDAKKRELRGMMSRQVSDKERLESRAIELFVKEKELRQR